MKIIEILKSLYGAKSNKHLLAYIIKDAIFWTLFFYIALNSNSYCVQMGLPTVKEYQERLINKTFTNFTPLLTNMTNSTFQK
jgi:hypothetical protein